MNTTLDVRGVDSAQAITQLKAALELPELTALEILSAEEKCIEQVIAVLSSQGLECEVAVSGHEYKLSVAIADKKASVSKAYVVSTNIIGKGDDELGKKLMTAFFNVHSQYQDAPKSAFFMNSGATLCIEGADTLLALKEMEAKGTEIIVCGTCLDYFNLTDKLAVGRVGSMHDLVSLCQSKSDVVHL